MRRYLSLLFATWAALLLLTAAFTRLIDPYGFWGGPLIDGLNRAKPVAGRHLIAVKLAQAERIQPRLMIAGNSRVTVGFDPLSPAWPASVRPVYNMGLAGKYPEQVADTVITALDRVRPRELILGVDLVDFRVAHDKWMGWRGHSPPAASPVRDRIAMLISLDALTDSALAIVEQHRRWPATTTPEGLNPLAEYNAVVADIGHAGLFDKRIADNSAKYRAGAKAVAWPEPGTSLAWDSLDRVVAACAKRGIKLTLVTYPYHVTLLQVFADTGLWPAFEDWQRRLAAYGNARDIQVWNFSRISPQTAEPVPPPGDTRAQMRWYWEGGHFKSALGDEMIRELTGQTPPYLGVRITPANVESVIAETRARLPRSPR